MQRIKAFLQAFVNMPALARSAAASALIFAAFAAAVHFWVVRRTGAEGMTERQKAIQNALAGADKRLAADTRQDPESVLEKCRLADFRDLALIRITVLDQKGRFLACTDKSIRDGAEQNLRALDMIRKGDRAFYTETDGRIRTLNYLVTLPGREHGVSAAQFRFDVSDIDVRTRGMGRKILFLGFILFFSILLLMLPSFRGTVSLFQELKRGMSLIASGNYRFFLKTQKGGPARDIIHSFNGMAEQLKSREEKTRRFQEKLKALAVSPDLDRLFANIMQLVKNEMQVDEAVIMVIRDDSLVVSSVAGYPDDAVLKEETYRLDEDVFTELVEYGKPVILGSPDEIRTNTRYADLVRQSGPVALFPITQGEQIYGIIHAAGAQNREPFGADEIDTGTFIAHGAAIAMTNLIEYGKKKGAAPKTPPGPRVQSVAASDRLRLWAISAVKGREVLFTRPIRTKKDRALVFIISALAGQKPMALDAHAGGILDLLEKLQNSINDLSYFALSVLSGMPVSPRRDNYLKKFKDAPLKPERVAALLTAPLQRISPAVKIGMIQLDLAAHDCLIGPEGLKEFPPVAKRRLFGPSGGPTDQEIIGMLGAGTAETVLDKLRGLYLSKADRAGNVFPAFILLEQAA